MNEKNEIEVTTKLLKDNKELDSAVYKLTDFILVNKKLSFPLDKFNETTVLAEHQIVTIKAEKITIDNYLPVAIKMYSHFKTILKFRVTKDFSKQAAFINDIRKSFTSGKHSRDYNNLENAFWKIIISEANTKYDYDFTDYINKITSKGIQELSFIRNYSSMLHALNLKDENIITNAVHLIKLTNNTEAAWNVDQQRVLEGIRQRALLNPENTLSLFKLLIEKNEITHYPIISALVVGLYEGFGQVFYQQHLSAIIAQKKHTSPILNGLSSIRSLIHDDVVLFIKLFDDHIANEELLSELANILFCVLKADPPVSKENVKQVFSRLAKMARKNHGGMANVILREVTYLDPYEKERVNLLLAIINQGSFPIDDIIQAVANAMFSVKDVKQLQKILLALASRAKFQDISHHFSSAFYDIDQSDLDKMLIGFFLDDRAYVRYLAIDMFNHSGKAFNLNLLKLTPLEQYKIWVAMCHNILEPKNFLPPLFPLLQSASETVRESFICRLELYTEDYGSHIIRLLEKNLDMGNVSNQNVVSRIKKYSDDYFESNVKIKQGIPEINPYYAHYKIFTKFDSIYRREFNASMQKSSEKSPLLSLVSTIQLAKGGGWKIGSKNEISKLSSFPMSMNLPRSYFAFPDEYEMVHGMEQKEDWDKDTFSEIIKWIANEQ